nr:ribonuclease H-like domain-containing protein [Tanacetum cinerariifolium]
IGLSGSFPSFSAMARDNFNQDLLGFPSVSKAHKASFHSRKSCAQCGKLSFLRLPLPSVFDDTPCIPVMSDGDHANMSRLARNSFCNSSFSFDDAVYDTSFDVGLDDEGSSPLQCDRIGSLLENAISVLVGAWILVVVLGLGALRKAAQATIFYACLDFFSQVNAIVGVMTMEPISVFYCHPTLLCWLVGQHGEYTSQPPQPPITSPEAPQMVSSIKLPILKKGEYILWTMKMEQYLAHTDYALWEVILNDNSAIQMTKDDAGNKIEVPYVTTHQILAKTRERKSKSTLLMAIPDEHLARFYGIKDAKTLWAAIKTRFGEGLDKGYDRFQRLFSLLEIHEACVSTKDANQKFLRSLPSVWRNISLIMRNKPCIYNLDIDDMYNNLKVYEADIKGSYGSSSNSQNVAFVSAESTSSTNEFNAAYNVSTATDHSSQAQGSSSYTDELMFLFFANQSSTPKLDNEDLEQIDQDDFKEIDLKWQVAMLSMRVKRFYKKTRRKLEFNGKEPVGFDKTKVECFNCHRRWNFARDCRSVRNSWNRSRDAGNARDNEKEATDFALMAFTLNPSSSLSSNSEDSLANDRFKKGEGYHAVSPPLTGNYMPPKPDLSFAGLDDSIYKFKISETLASLTKDALKTSTACVEKPKEDRSSTPLIEDCDTNSDDDRAFKHEPIPAKIDFVKAGKSDKHVKPVESVKHGHPQQALKNKGIVDSGCSRHMTGNKAYLADYQKVNNEGFVAFGSSRCKITGKASIDESNLWHKRLGHVNFKTINKLVKGNLVRGLPSKIFDNDHSCVACQKGKQHKATCKAKLTSSIRQPLQMLHMDLFGLTSVMSINHKKYCLVVTDDFSRFSWVFFLATKDETSKVLKPFIIAIENQINKKLIQVLKIHTDDNLVDLLTKAFDVSRFNFLKANIEMLNM